MSIARDVPEVTSRYLRWRGPARPVMIAAALVAVSCTGEPPDRSTSAPPRNPAAVVEGEPYRPRIDPAGFVAAIDNPYLPLVPGTTLRYEGSADGEEQSGEVTVTDESRVILGVSTTVVRDRVSVAGELVEETFDWFAQDRFGNVWYFGEASNDYEGGEVVSTAGSWEAGRDGAQPGIVMLAEPRVGDAYHQESYAGEAEDRARVVSLDVTVKVPHGFFVDVVATEDWTPLEPGVLERKLYARGVGLVVAELLEGGQEELRLVDVRSEPA